jgi:hypothetical protein
MRKREVDWEGIVIGSLIAVFIIALLVWAGVSTIRDQRAKSECFAGNKQVVQAEHGEGWSCR